MQKIYNLLGVLGFVMSGSLVGLSIAAFVRIPGMIEDYADSLTGELTGKVTDMLPGQVDELMPEMPSSTGPAVPFKMP